MENNPAFQEVYLKIKKITMTSMEKCYALYKVVTHIAETPIEGDFVECGVWKGRSSTLAALTLQYVNQGHRKIYLDDTYTRMGNPPRRISISTNGQPISTRLKSIKIEDLEWIVTQELSSQLLSKYVENDAIGLSLNAAWIFKKEIIDLFDGHLYNYHNAKLPQEKGVAI